MAWNIQVRTNTGTNVTSAMVSLRPFAPGEQPYPPVQLPSDTSSVTHRHQTGGVYERLDMAPNPEAGGDWVLVVSADGHSTVVQPVNIGTTGGKPLARTVTPTRHQALSVSIPNKTVVAGSTGPGATFVVTLYPRSEVVMVAGADFHAGESQPGNDGVPSQVQYRRDLLSRTIPTGGSSPSIDEGTHVVVFSLEEAWMRVFVRATGSHWLLIGDRYDIYSVVRVYEYLSSVGQLAPETVREVSFFSHAWQEGPILRRTRDHLPFSTRRRDDNDQDARRKDFDIPNISAWQAIPQALAPQGDWRIWGCFSSPRIVTLAAFLNANGPNAGFKQLISVDKHKLYTIENTNGAIADQACMEYLRMRGYAAGASSVLGNSVRVYGPPPGTWTRYNRQRFWVPWNETAAENGDSQSFATMNQFLSQRFMTRYQHDADGYMNYTALETDNVPAVRPNSQYICIVDVADSRWLYFHHYPRITLVAGSGTPSLTSTAISDVRPIVPGAVPPVPGGISGTIHRLSTGGIVLDCFVVAEDVSSSGEGGLRVFEMKHSNGNPEGIKKEWRPNHRVELLAQSATIGKPVSILYWEVPAGGSVGIAKPGQSPQSSLRAWATPVQFAGQLDLATTGLAPGTYVVRCFDRLNALLGESADSFTLS